MTTTLTEATESVQEEAVKGRVNDLTQALKSVINFRLDGSITRNQWAFQRDRIGKVISEMCAQYPLSSAVSNLRERYNANFRYNTV